MSEQNTVITPGSVRHNGACTPFHPDLHGIRMGVIGFGEPERTIFDYDYEYEYEYEHEYEHEHEPAVNARQSEKYM